jgi:hypothetical protein
MTQRWAVVRRSGQEILYVDLLEGITSEDHARQEARYLLDDLAAERDLIGVSGPSASTMTVHLHRITIHEDVDYLREQGDEDDQDPDQDPG